VNQLIEAPEDGGIDDLNDETFGDSAENCEYHRLLSACFLMKLKY